ncbi:hypothetical protein J4216_02655 [Candidatus Woesearchaeota archaeon]|nr:hypothetical protein [Candidatus Woesearchaeota archaeon]
MIELIQNKWFWFLVAGLLLAIGYRLMFGRKDKTLIALQKEYYELTHSEKYKVKGRSD